jgi:uncharacterized membrane protein YbaN (DUF454 family)
MFDKNKDNNVFLPYKTSFLELAIPFFAKHHQNFRVELLHHRVLEQSSSRVEWSHAKHALKRELALVIHR